MPPTNKSTTNLAPVPLNTTTMNAALDLFLKVDTPSSNDPSQHHHEHVLGKSHRQLLHLYARCKASTASALEAATKRKGKAMHAGLTVRPGLSRDVAFTAKSKPQTGLFRGMKSMDVKRKPMQSREGGGHNLMSPAVRNTIVKKMGKIDAIGKSSVVSRSEPPPSAMNFLAALNSNKAVTRKKAPVVQRPSTLETTATPDTKRGNDSSQLSDSKRKYPKRKSTPPENASLQSRSKKRGREKKEEDGLLTDDEKYFNVGDEVVVFVEEERKKNYAGVVKRCEAGGTYEVKFDNGEELRGILKTNISLSDKSTIMPERSAAKQKKDRDSAQLSESKRRYPKRRSIPSDSGSPQSRSVQRRKEKDEEESTESGDSFLVGDEVVVFVEEEGKKNYAGVVKRCESNGTYEVKFDNGEVLRGISKANISLSDKSSAKSKRPATKTKKVSESALPLESTQRYPKRKSTSYDSESPQLKGGKEGNVDISKESGEFFFMGDEVVVFVEEEGKKNYPGVIKRCEAGGTYEVKLTNGEVLRGIVKEKISLSDKLTTMSEATVVGSNKKYQETSQPLKSSRRYPKRKSTPPENASLQSRSKKRRREKKEDDDLLTDDEKYFNVGDEVVVFVEEERKKNYAGAVKRCEAGGTYEVKFDNGEELRGILKTNISLSDKSTIMPERSAAAKQKKDKDSAQLSESKRRYPKRRSIPSDSGSPQSRSVQRRKEKDEEESTESGDSFLVGDEVVVFVEEEGKKNYAGVVKRCESNGTYEVKFDNGEVLRGISKANISLSDT